MTSLIELSERPSLRDPFLVMHLTGWTDAGLAGETSTVFLRTRWNARPLARFDSDELLDFRARRPVVRIADGTVESVEWTGIEVLLAQTTGSRDALLLTGPEPDFRWHAFSRAVSRICKELGVTEVFGLGGFPAPALHTEPVAILGTSADPKLARRLDTVPAVVELSGGIQTVLESQLYRDGIPATGIWARVPPYLAGGTHPPAALALVRTLVLLTGIDVDTSELEEASSEHLEQVEQAIRERPQIADFIDQIRAVVEQGSEGIPSGDEIAAELERFLSDQPPGDPGSDPER
jgi:proteasome assembly chaperone (PAC2) family protein